MTSSCLNKLKAFNEIPCKKSLLPIAIDLILQGGPKYLHAHFHKRHKQLGPILRERMGPYELVSIAEPSLIRKTIANEGRCPQTKLPPAWTLYNETMGLERGLFFQSGESWLRMRKCLDKVLLDSTKIDPYADGVWNITQEILDFWLKRKSTGPGELILEDFSRDLSIWSVEAVGFMLFGRRMDPATSITFESSKVSSLVDDAIQMFRLSSKLQLIPVEVAKALNLKVWKDFCTSTTNLIKRAEVYVDQYHSNRKQSPERCSDSGLLGDMLKSNNLTENELSRIAIDLIIAAADTSAVSIQWALYLLAKNPHIQRGLHYELSEIFNKSNCSIGKTIEEEAPILRGFIRETLRLYPPAPFISRILNQDIALGEYLIPAGKHIIFPLYSTGRDEENFESPLELKPERWIRDGDSDKKSSRHRAIASLPFGLGSRMCIGRKMALLEMQLFIAAFVQRFECSLIGDQEVGIKLNMTTWPDRPIRLKLKLRAL